MSKLKDLTGMRFGRLTVIGRGDDYIYPNGKHRVKWKCKCDCGNVIEITANNLGRHANSCGCLNKENTKKALIKENEYDLSGLYGVGYTCNTNKEFKFDLEDYELVRQYYWRENQNGYCVNKRWKSKTTFLHRLIMNCPDDMYVDHINGDRLDNRKQNLRIVTMSQNNMNQKQRENTSSGVTGVTWKNREQKWIAKIHIDGKEIYLGSYTNKEDAIKARREAENKYFGEYSYNNSQKRKGE